MFIQYKTHTPVPYALIVKKSKLTEPFTVEPDLFPSSEPDETEIAILFSVLQKK